MSSFLSQHKETKREKLYETTSKHENVVICMQLEYNNIKNFKPLNKCKFLVKLCTLFYTGFLEKQIMQIDDLCLKEHFLIFIGVEIFS